MTPDLSVREQIEATQLARQAASDPRAAERLAARFVALAAVFKQARRNRYLMCNTNVRPIIDRAAQLMETT
jgi:hypothetical protein